MKTGEAEGTETPERGSGRSRVFSQGMNSRTLKLNMELSLRIKTRNFNIRIHTISSRCDPISSSAGSY